MQRLTKILLLGMTVYLLAGCAVQRSFVWPMSVEESVDRPVLPGANLVWITAR